MPRGNPDEPRERAGARVRLYREADPKPVIRRLAEQLNIHPEALRNRIRQDQADRDARPRTEILEENRRPRREVAEPQRVNDVLRAASLSLAGEIDPTRRRSKLHRRPHFPVDLVLRVLAIPSSTYYGWRARAKTPSPRQRGDNEPLDKTQDIRDSQEFASPSYR